MKKDKDTYELEDFLIDESFIEWVRSAGSVNLFWTNYCKRNPHKAGTIEQAKTIIQSLKVRDEHYSDQEIDRIKRNIERSILDAGMRHLNKVSPSRPRYLWWRRIAACLVIIAGTYFIADYLIGQFRLNETDNITELVAKSTQAGQKLTIYLSDGSKVKLNANSTVSYPKLFDNKNRVVRLTGEAFFEVAHDASRPFRVITDQLNTEVLGTSFNVQAYPEDEITEVVLVSGKVSITKSDAGHEEKHILSPGQAAAYNRQNSVLDVSVVDVNKAIAWKDGIILFENASRQEVFDRLADWYGVDFEIENSRSVPWSYTGRFDNLSLEDVLVSLGFVKRFEFTIRNDKVIIQFKE